MTKYRSKKTVVDGLTFDSRKEALRYKDLKALEERGEITDLKRQVRYRLIETQRDPAGKVIERPCDYVADFVYQENGGTVVEDVKGVRLPEYIIKRKLMLSVYGIRIKEI